MRARPSHIFSALVSLVLAVPASAEPAQTVLPKATVTPVDVYDTSPFGATTLDLKSFGYVEKEYYITGNAKRYCLSTTNPLATAQPIDQKYSNPYKSRILVRRPKPEYFNGTVVIEWYNVTLGGDEDFEFAAMYEHLLAKGYAYVAVSAQLVGVNELTKWSAARYSSLNISASNSSPTCNPGGTIDSTGDVLSWDIFGQTAKAVLAGAGLDDLKPKRVIALGESQSAARLTEYYNSIQPLHQVFESFLLLDRAGALRDDLDAKLISSVSSINVPPAGPGGKPGPLPTDGKNTRWWEVAGASHASLHDVAYLDPIIWSEGILHDASGNPISLTAAVTGCSENPILSRVPEGQVLNAGLEALVAWTEFGRVPPHAPRLLRDPVTFLPVLDADGRVTGGVRLPAYDAPMAANGGYNSGPGFCIIAGYHQDYSQTQMCALYKNPNGYVSAVKNVANVALMTGFMVKDDVDATIAQARALDFSCPVNTN
jgi:Alpha/beta hydrolase domain